MNQPNTVSPLKALLIGLGLIAVGVGILFFLALPEKIDSDKLDDHGVETVATPTGNHFEGTTTEGRRGLQTTYQITYKFEAENGRTYNAYGKTNYENYENVQRAIEEAGEVTVRYLPEDPYVSEVISEEPPK